MSTGRAIVAGYEWRQRFVASSALFPSGSAYSAQVRATVDASSALATLTTADGDITRIDDRTIEIVIDGATTAAWAVPSVVFDLVRTDTTPDQHLGFRVRVSMAQPVTRL